MSDEIDRIRARWQAATPGPWRWVASEGRWHYLVSMAPNAPAEGHEPQGPLDQELAVPREAQYLRETSWGTDERHRIIETDGGFYGPRGHDATAIAYAPDDVAYLLERIGVLEAELADARLAASHCDWPGCTRPAGGE